MRIFLTILCPTPCDLCLNHVFSKVRRLLNDKINFILTVDIAKVFIGCN